MPVTWLTALQARMERLSMRAAHSPTRKFIIATILAVLLSSRSAPALADERVEFESAVIRSEQHSAGVGQPGAAIKGYLTKPNGEGPFPAVVLLHSCLGLPLDRSTIGKMVASWGYVALFVDDFVTRGLKQTCTVDFPEGVADAYGALNYVARFAFVDRTRIAAVGYSQGADTALTIASDRFASAFVLPQGVKFKAAAAFYPPCANQGDATLALPTLILVGERDDVTPAADCARLARAQPRGISKLRLIVLAGAEHAFDNPEFTGGARVFGMWLKYDGAAAEQAKAELHRFLAIKLRQPGAQ
jgi:dienelactone hydrolase